MTRQRPRPRLGEPWGAATLVVALSLMTSAAAHVEAGGLLPGLAGCALLLLTMDLLWLLASRTTRTPAGLVMNFSLGQLLCHIAYQVGAMRPPTLIIEADGTRHWGDPMAGAMVGHDMTGHAMGGMDPSMAGMDHGSHGMSAMLVAHAAAVLVSTALVIALRRLAAVAHRWLAAVLPEATSHLVLTPLVRPTTAPRRRTPRWALAPPPPRRGPPLTA